MPKKVSRKDRRSTGEQLSKPKKRVPPHKRKGDKIVSASSKKIKIQTSQSVVEEFEKNYRIVDFVLVFSAISTLVKCATCGGKILFESCKIEGLGFAIKVGCDNCEPRYVPSSEKIDNSVYEINFRFVFVMRILGLGLAGCNKFCGLMDLSRNFLSKPAYSSYVNKMASKIRNVTERFLSSAVREEKNATCKANNLKDTSELTVSGDGTWKKRGFSSLYGVATLIGYFTGKVLDLLVKSAYCQICKVWESKLDEAEFEEWKEEHIDNGDCSANHIGASGNMEVEAIKEMFQRSTEKQVHYRNYIGDGDSKTYTGVLNSKPYGENYVINKKECVGHVQKRMGTRLRELVKNTVEDTVTTTGKKIKKKFFLVKVGLLLN